MDKEKQKKGISENFILPKEKDLKSLSVPAAVNFAVVLPALSACCYSLYGILAAVLIGIIFSLVYWFFKPYRIGYFTVSGMAMSVLLAAFIFFRSAEGFYNGLFHLHSINRLFFIVCAAIITAFILNTVFSLIIRFCGNNRVNLPSAGTLALSSAAFFVTIKIYLPLDTFVNNIADFNFAVQDFIFIPATESVIILLLSFYIGLILKPKIGHLLSSLLLGATVAVYVQYTFMNSNLGLVIGIEPEWEKYTSFVIFNAAVWVVIIAAPFIAGAVFKKHREKIVTLASGFVTAVQLMSILILAFFSGEDIYGYRNSVVPDARVQYDVASDKNIITFFFDATDNLYFKQLLEESPEAFDGLEDFTLYTNTCAKYSYTDASMNQILTGTEEDDDMTEKWIADAWSNDKTQNFYKRLHQAGYVVNGFVDDGTDWGLMDGCYDNTDYNMKPSAINYPYLASDMEKLSFYRYAPFFLKRLADVTHINCNNNVFYGTEFKFFDNEYMENLKLTKRGDWEKCFLIQHLFGTHPPCDDFIAETKNCLDIVKEYIRQLKELGVYDSSVIIVTADHGRHNYELYDYKAPTPIFMIKEANNRFNEMKISSAPVYHTDFLSTYLVSAGLYTDSDRDIYGSSVYDFDEKSRRLRKWNYKFFDEQGKSEWITFEYIGDSEELSGIIEEYNEKHPIF